MAEEDVVYRVWIKHFEPGNRVSWSPISQTFSTGRDAKLWASSLNTDDYRIEEEEA